MKPLRIIAALTCPFSVVAVTLSPSPWVKWVIIPVFVGAIAAVIVSLRDKHEQSTTERAALRLRH